MSGSATTTHKELAALVSTINDALKAKQDEIDVLRGVDCLVDGDGPCGCCVKCLRLRAEKAEAERDASRDDAIHYLGQSSEIVEELTALAALMKEREKKQAALDAEIEAATNFETHRWCGFQYPSGGDIYCTRLEDHEGDHVAAGPRSLFGDKALNHRKILARWSSSPTPTCVSTVPDPIPSLRQTLAAAESRVDAKPVHKRSHEYEAEVANQRAAAISRAEKAEERITRVEALAESLTEMLDWYYPREDEGQTGFYDRITMMFYAETHIWPPGKSAPMEMHLDDSDEAREKTKKAWTEWLTKRRNEICTRARTAIATAQPGKET